MRKLLFILLLIPSVSNAQAVARLLRFLSPPAATTPMNFVWVDSTNSYRMKVMNVDTARNLILVNTGTAGTYNRVTTDAKGRVTSGAVDSSYVATRSFNTNFTISSTRASLAIYSVQITSNAGNTGTVYLEYSADTTTWVEASRTANTSNGVGNTQISTLYGRIPANYFVRLRSVTGGTTITFISGQETLL